MNLRQTILSKLGILHHIKESNFQFNKELLLIAKINTHISNQLKDNALHLHEFSVFSQSGDDGIVQYLVSNIAIENKIFIEFGVEDYKESNTRFLLINNNWQGLVIDSSQANIEYIRKDPIYWKYDLITFSSFITKENINQLIAESGIGNYIGFLHIDLVGNNYWVWKEMSIKPEIVSIEYNSVFGNEKAITVPYYPDFYRTNHHFSNLYFGCSLKALTDLADEKGYIFIGSNSMGNTAYFLRSDKSEGFKALTADEGYVLSKFRESRDKAGNLTYIRGEDRLKTISGMPVYNTRTGKIENLP
jgi:hypothetical protein